MILLVYKFTICIITTNKWILVAIISKPMSKVTFVEALKVVENLGTHKL